jgi:hypothetical protein
MVWQMLSLWGRPLLLHSATQMGWRAQNEISEEAEMFPIVTAFFLLSVFFPAAFHMQDSLVGANASAQIDPPLWNWQMNISRQC